MVTAKKSTAAKTGARSATVGKSSKATAHVKVAKKQPIAQKVSKIKAPKSVEAKSTRPAPAADKLDALGIDAVCEDLIDGKTMTAIAKSAGVSIGSLFTWLAVDAERSARAREARIQAAKGWDELALAGINKARNTLELAKAREAAFHLRWRASKIAPKEYGDKMAIGQADDLLPLVLVKDLTGRKD